MALAHTLGFARAAHDLQLDALYTAWCLGERDAARLQAFVACRRAEQWQAECDAGMSLVSVGDGIGFDPVLTQALTFGLVPAPRQSATEAQPTLAALFDLAARDGCRAGEASRTTFGEAALRQLAPLTAASSFTLHSAWLLEAIKQAQALGHAVKPVLLGPLSYLWSSERAGAAFDPLTLIDRLLPLYDTLFNQLAAQGVEWVQIDEPILAQALPQAWKNAYERVYNMLQRAPLKKLVATCHGALADNLGLAANLPVDGLHIDLVSAPEQYPTLVDRLPAYKILSLGVVSGGNAQPGDAAQTQALLRHAAVRLGERLWVAPSCPLPYGETAFVGAEETASSLARQKCREVTEWVEAVRAWESAACARAAA